VVLRIPLWFFGSVVLGGIIFWVFVVVFYYYWYCFCFLYLIMLFFCFVFFLVVPIFCFFLGCIKNTLTLRGLSIKEKTSLV
jgi:hypothetical protein